VRSYKVAAMITTTLFQTAPVFAEETDIINPPDEAFLEFLANMSEVDGDYSDPLDMLELESVEVNGAPSAKQEDTNQELPLKSKILSNKPAKTEDNK